MNKTWFTHSGAPPSNYDREPIYHDMTSEKDVAVSMRDGVALSIDVYRPASENKFPALLAFAIYNQDIQGPARADSLPPQPSWGKRFTSGFLGRITIAAAQRHLPCQLPPTQCRPCLTAPGHPP